MLENEQTLTITPTEDGMEILISMIYNTHYDILLEQHESLEAAMESLTKRYTEDYGFTFIREFEIQENGSARAMIRA